MVKVTKVLYPKICFERFAIHISICTSSGDIGIDDISFTPGCTVLSTQTLPPFIYSTTPMPGCNATHAYCLTDKTQCIPREQFCNFYIECNDKTDELSCPISCSFEQKTLCQWTHDAKQKLKWSFGNSDTSSANTGPSFGKVSSRIRFKKY